MSSGLAFGISLIVAVILFVFGHWILAIIAIPTVFIATIAIEDFLDG